MPGNTFGRSFVVTTFGESHGPAVGAVVDGCPPGIPLEEQDFKGPMDRRRPGRNPYDSPRNEEDRVEILSGVFDGMTTGTPIGLLIRNRDADSGDYSCLEKVFRPGHGDLTYYRKYGRYDHRGGGRASARETASRVAASVVARKVLEPHGLRVLAFALEIGGVRAERIDEKAAQENPLSCPDPEAASRISRILEECRQTGDSVGGIVETRVSGCPAGLGEPVFDKLDADLAGAFMSVGAVKGVEIGAGFGSSLHSGSLNNDPITPGGFESNHAGGILAGVSSGADIVIRAAVKPIPSISPSQRTMDRLGNQVILNLSGRFDVCAVPRAIPVLEAMTWLVLADHFLRWRGQCGEQLQATKSKDGSFYSWAWRGGPPARLG